MGWNSSIWSLLTVLIWNHFIWQWSASQVPGESRRILTFISQEIIQACLYRRKETANYTTTILNFIVKFNASPVQKTVMKKGEQVSGLFSWCFVFSLIRKKQEQHFICSQIDFCIVLGTILLHRAELHGSLSNQFSDRFRAINSECTFLHMFFKIFYYDFLDILHIKSMDVDRNFYETVKDLVDRKYFSWCIL